MAVPVPHRPHALALAASMISACAPDATTAPSAPVAQAAAFPDDAVALDWQGQARTLVAAGRLSALAAGRTYAALSVAQHRALASVDAAPSLAGAVPAQGFGSGGRSRWEAERGAVAGASSRVLGYLFPAAATALEQRVSDQAEAGPGSPHPHFALGVEAGRAAGDAMIDHLKGDGFTRAWVGPARTGPGIWIPAALPPAGGTLGMVTPYYLSSGSQLRPPAPPAFGSPEFAAALQEVVTRTQQRTSAELAIARAWDYGAGTPTPPGYWNAVAAQLASARGLDESTTTELFAIMHAAMFDAMIGCWDAKYEYWLIRPYQASGAISLALGAPNHPSYPSGHSCVSAAAGRVLETYFPDMTTELERQVEEAGLSRLLAGIHYRFDIVAGQQLGRSAAELALAHGAP